MLTLGFIKHFVILHADIAYLIIILGVFLEGEIVVIFAGIFAHLGSFNIFISFGAILIGCGLKSVIGYSLGYYINKNHSHLSILKQTEKRINYFLPHFTEKPFLSLFLSRFLILGMYWFALIYAGYTKVKLKTFIKAEIASFFVWATVMLSLGYFFSYTALSITRDIHKIFLLFLIFLITFFILEKIIAFIIELFETKEVNK